MFESSELNVKKGATSLVKRNCNVASKCNAVNESGFQCRLVDGGVSAALRSIQQIMTVVLRRKLNVKLLPLVSVKWNANYIEKLENPATVPICHFLF